MHSDPQTQLYFARFSDGKSAASFDAKVRLTDRGVAIELLDRHEPLIWPYGALSSAEPLNQKSIDALLTYKHQPGATLFVADAGFARKLAVAAPQMSASALRWRHATPFIWVAAGVAVISAVMWIANLSPSRAIAGLLPDKVRIALGKQTLESMTTGHPVCKASKGVAALDRLTAKLSKAAGGKTKFNVVVVDWNLVNAFATPGEQIVLTRGLIAKATSSDEIAGVLAHEMGHGIEMHPETNLVRVIGLTAALELMMGGAGGTIGNIGLLLAQLSYSREAEREADAIALALLKEATISPKGLDEFFDRVSEKGRAPEPDKPARDFSVFSSHPPTNERRKMIEAQPPYPATPALSAEDWDALRDVCNKPVAPDTKQREI